MDYLHIKQIANIRTSEGQAVNQLNHNHDRNDILLCSIMQYAIRRNNKPNIAYRFRVPPTLEEGAITGIDLSGNMRYGAVCNIERGESL